MQLGFVSAIFPDLSLQEVLEFAAAEGFRCVEVMCWPPGKADRRYAGVTHLDVTNFGESEAAQVRRLTDARGISISGLGYYPNPLHPDPEHRRRVVDHLLKVIEAARKLDVGVVNTFIGRDHTLSVEDNWPLLMETWKPIVDAAEKANIRIGIENCPMIFTNDEWPGGKNIATSPAIWRRLFHDLKSEHLGLNIDPSHLVWLHIDAARCLREFGPRIFHVHAKDTRIDADQLYQVGIMGLGWHTPKLPGLGDVDWTHFFSALTDTGYNGPVCIEVEDRAYERSLDDRKRSLRQSRDFLKQFVSG